MSGGATTPTQRIVHPPGYRNGRLHFDDPRYAVLRTDFDVAAYTREVQGRLHFDASEVRIPPIARRDLEYLWRVENSAITELRALLSSWTGNEARITAFLASWAFERYWMAHAVKELLATDGHPEPEPTSPRGLEAHVRNAYVEYLLPIVSPLVSMAVGEPVTAGHMARMAVHEGALWVAYHALLDEVDGTARGVFEEIIARRRPMVSFFRQEATTRIQRSAAERRAARTYLRGWEPLRVGGVPDADGGRALRSLFHAPEIIAMLAESDDSVGSLLPGRPRPSIAALRRAGVSRELMTANRSWNDDI